MSQNDTPTTDQFGHRVPTSAEMESTMTYDDLSDDEVAEYEAAATEAFAEIEEERQACDHESRTFHTEDTEVGVPAASACDDCTDLLLGDEAREFHGE